MQTPGHWSIAVCTRNQRVPRVLSGFTIVLGRTVLEPSVDLRPDIESLVTSGVMGRLTGRCHSLLSQRSAILRSSSLFLGSCDQRCGEPLGVVAEGSATVPLGCSVFVLCCMSLEAAESRHLKIIKIRRLSRPAGSRNDVAGHWTRHLGSGSTDQKGTEIQHKR
ncbi:hypothetical protein Efla_004054 [Eimeria flavescens]